MSCPLLPALHLAWAPARALSDRYEREIGDPSNGAVCAKRPSLSWVNPGEAQVSS